MEPRRHARRQAMWRRTHRRYRLAFRVHRDLTRYKGPAIPPSERHSCADRSPSGTKPLTARADDRRVPHGAGIGFLAFLRCRLVDVVDQFRRRDPVARVQHEGLSHDRSAATPARQWAVADVDSLATAHIGDGPTIERECVAIGSATPADLE